MALASASAASARAHDAVPAPTVSPANAYAILARVKTGLRSHGRPPYVSYTLIRRELLDGVPDLLNSYTLRIWCRTADSAALSRHAFGSRATGGAEFITPAFDRPIDPGPPTADLLDVIRQTQGAATPSPQATVATASPPVIGSVAVAVETKYLVTFAGVDGADDHLRLEARRDPDRNRLTDLYVDRTTYALHRAVAHDHLYTDGRTIPERFEIDFGAHDGVPVITSIHGQTDYAALDARDAGEPLHEVNYRFDDIAFPPELPAWYFDPAQYGEHRAEFPV
jgi:hypothetical protein